MSSICNVLLKRRSQRHPFNTYLYIEFTYPDGTLGEDALQHGVHLVYHHIYDLEDLFKGSISDGIDLSHQFLVQLLQVVLQRTFGRGFRLEGLPPALGVTNDLFHLDDHLLLQRQLIVPWSLVPLINLLPHESWPILGTKFCTTQLVC